MADSRVRKLTMRGQDLYDSNYSKHVSGLLQSETQIESALSRARVVTHSQQLSAVFNEIDTLHNKYLNTAKDFFGFLGRTATSQSLAQLSVNQLRVSEMSTRVQKVLTEIKDQMISCKTDEMENIVSVSQTSKTSYRSNASSVLQRQKEKAELARVKLAEAEKESQIAQAELHGMQKLLAAEVEDRKIDITPHNSDINQFAHDSAHTDMLGSLVTQHTPPDNVSQYVPPGNTTQSQYVPQDNVTECMPTYQQDGIPPPSYVAKQYELCSELSRFLMKRDLLISRLSKFNDKPGYFAVWETSFTRIMDDLGVSPLEEMDLLIKWLGPESSKQALSIRAANTHDPERGLQRIWQRLKERYASPEIVESTLKMKLSAFPKIISKDYTRLYDLSDIVSEIESMKDNVTYAPLLAYFDSSVGVTPIVHKLPYSIQEKWISEAAVYKENHNVTYPPFSIFASFLRKHARIRNDPSFQYQNVEASKPSNTLTNRKQEKVVSNKLDVVNMRLCPFHDKLEGHTLNYCKAFRRLSLPKRKEFLQKQGICFRCCNSDDHIARICKEQVECFFCKSNGHPTALHRFEQSPAATSNNQSPSLMHGEHKTPLSTPKVDGGEQKPVSSMCSQICDNRHGGKSCAKTVLVKVFPKGKPEHTLITYAVLDDQSNRSLARSELFDYFSEKGNETEYSLASCAGSVVLHGRQADGYVVQAIDNSTTLTLPTLIECNQVPNVRHEIPTPEAAMYHSHLSDIASFIPPLNPDAEVLLLIGRDLPSAHHVLEQRIGPSDAPFSQKLNLGWVIVGEVCLGKVHPPDHVTVNKTHILPDGRATFMKPCPSLFDLTENSPDLFQKTSYDNMSALSVEDKEFIKVMDAEFFRNSDGNWTAPLPFRSERPTLPNNRSQAHQRAQLLDKSLRRDPVKKEHMVTFMKNIIEKGHAEIAPPLVSGQESWYLPLFGVYHPRKPGKIRGVFDSSAKFNDISLNNVLMTGPDLTNDLLGILLRFRAECVAVTADVEQMFYCFKVRKDHRDYLRFLWYDENDPEKDLIEYRMTAHVFGNSPSPAIATYGLRRSVESAEKDVQHFVENDFYVDDSLLSMHNDETAIDLMKRTQKSLKDGGNLRLHKLASNSASVLSAFPTEDLATDLQDFDLTSDNPPLQRSLGMCWNLTMDTFTFRVSKDIKPFTRRGVLSTINSLYDPLGFVSPVTISGKLILKNLTSAGTDWDEQLDSSHLTEWERWCNSLQALENINISRPYGDISYAASKRKELHIFSDASREAISAVAYLKLYDNSGQSCVNFLLGKSKVAPSRGHTIPRLELCAAVLAVDISETLMLHLQPTCDIMKFYTDSMVVLGYISNEKRRFHVYVANRVDRIRRSSSPLQWNYVATDCNPADLATRSISVTEMVNSIWLKGPNFLHTDGENEILTPETFTLVDPENDNEVRPAVNNMKTAVKEQQNLHLGSSRFEKFSSWRNLVKTISHLKHIGNSFHHEHSGDPCMGKGWHQCSEFRNVIHYEEAETLIIKTVQHECYPRELNSLLTGEQLSKNSSLSSLSPVLDDSGVLRVGGRLSKGQVSNFQTNPIIIPRKHHIANLLVRHFHAKTEHQGRLLTEAAVRTGGYWIIGAKRLVSSIISKCVQCRRLRRAPETQKMSDLPDDRLMICPPFTYVGVDAFGPWDIVTRRTRGGSAHGKRWAIMFTCLVIRAVHIDLVEEMSSACFINCLRRFVSVRGEVKQFRSDRGTNFIGSTDQLCINAVNVEDTSVQSYLYDSGVTWIFNSPHSSHKGGIWERMIGIARRILNSILLSHNRPLTHEVLLTFMCEVMAIMNARPITAISTDAQEPLPLSPAMLLTQKYSQMPSFTIDLHLDLADMYKSQWRHVQILAEQFWQRWKRDYLHTLQTRSKWKQAKPNLKPSDVVLIKDKQSTRNNWPIGVVETVHTGQDGLVRTASVRIHKDRKLITYTRPVTELVLLL